MEWEPIETAPKDGRCILGYFNDLEQGPFYQLIGWDVCAEIMKRKPAWRNCCNEPWEGFTHWMPLPEPPK
jgi:hypothetical protein